MPSNMATFLDDFLEYGLLDIEMPIAETVLRHSTKIATVDES